MYSFGLRFIHMFYFMVKLDIKHSVLWISKIWRSLIVSFDHIHLCYYFQGRAGQHGPPGMPGLVVSELNEEKAVKIYILFIYIIYTFAIFAGFTRSSWCWGARRKAWYTGSHFIHLISSYSALPLLQSKTSIFLVMMFFFVLFWFPLCLAGRFWFCWRPRW